jgi:hypothetical protein
MRRTETIARKKDNFMGFNLRPYTPIERCEAIEQFLKDTPGIGMMVIEGEEKV